MMLLKTVFVVFLAGACMAQTVNPPFGGGGGGSGTVIVKLSGSTIGSPRGTLNFIPGSCIALAIADTGTQDNITAAVDTAACPVEKQWTLAATADGVTAVTAVDLPATNAAVPTLTPTTNGSLQLSLKLTSGVTQCFQLGDFSLPPVLPTSLDFRLKLLSSSATPFTLQVSTSGSTAADPTFNTADTVSFAASTTKTDAVITGLNLTGLVANGPLVMRVCAVTPAADVLAFNAKLQLH